MTPPATRIPTPITLTRISGKFEPFFSGMGMVIGGCTYGDCATADVGYCIGVIYGDCIVKVIIKQTKSLKAKDIVVSATNTIRLWHFLGTTWLKQRLNVLKTWRLFQ